MSGKHLRNCECKHRGDTPHSWEVIFIPRLLPPFHQSGHWYSRLVASWVNHELKLWAQWRVTVWVLKMEWSEDARDNFTSRKKLSKLFFQIFLCLRCIYVMIFKILSMKGASLPPLPPGSVPPCKPQEEHQAELWDLPCSPTALTPHPLQLSLLSHPPVTLQGSQAGGWITYRVYRELEFPGAKSVCTVPKGLPLKSKEKQLRGGGEKSWKIKTTSGFIIIHYQCQTRAGQQKERPKCTFAEWWTPCWWVNLHLLETSLAPKERDTRDPLPQCLGSKTGAILNYLKMKPNALLAGKGRNEIVNSGHSLDICLVGFPTNFFFMVLPKAIWILRKV